MAPFKSAGQADWAFFSKDPLSLKLCMLVFPMG